MLKYDNTVSSTIDGKPIYGAQVNVYDESGALASMFSDEAGTTALSQPVLTDQLGYFSFYIGDGKYDIRVMTGATEISRTNITMVDTLTLKARALVVPENEDAGTLPAAGQRLGMVLAFDAVTGAPTALLPNSFDGAPGAPGASGPANSTYATRALLKAAATTNLSAILTEQGYQGTFSWTPGDFTGAADDFNILASSTTAITVGAWVRQNATGAINVRDYRAIGNGVIDDTVALQAAVTAANALKLPVQVPTGRYVLNATLQPKYGIIGSGSALTRLMATNASAFASGKPMIRIGWTQAEDGNLCFAVPCRGLSVYGAGIRTAERSGDQSTMMFNGDGIFFDEQAHSVVASDIHVEFCRRGLDYGGVYGHLSTDHYVGANNWFNIYYSRNAFDYKHVDPTITGALFSCIGATGALDTSKVQAVGGIGGMTIFGGHMGFAPHGIYVEAGNGTIGLTALTCIDTRYEFMGNRAVAVVDSAKNSGILEFKSPGHSWSRDGNNNPDVTYSIVGNSSFPAQDYAVVLGNVTGSAAPSYRKGDQFKVGSSGKHTKINNLFDFWHDDKGIGGYEVASGQERLIFSGQFGYTGSVGVGSQTISATSGSQTSLGTIAIPEAHDGTLQARVVLAGLVADASAAVDVQLRVKINGGADQVVGIFSLVQGANNIPTEFMAFDIGRRTAGVHTVQVLLQFTGTSTVNLNNKGLGGQVRLNVAQNGGVA